MPADRVLYALRDRTGTVENPGLICASILSKKLAAGLDALVLDVKTGSGAFLRKMEDTEFLAALMVATAEAAGTRTVALLTDMGQPLGRAAGNWIELVECVELLRGERPAHSEDLRELSLILAGWMIHLGGKAETPEAGYRAARSGARRMAQRCAFFWRWSRRRAATFAVFDDPAAFTSRARRSGGSVGERLSLRRWTPRRWAGRCSAPARAARKPASRSIRTRAFCFMRGAARRSSAASRSRRSTRRSTAHARRAGGDPASKAITIARTSAEPVPLVSRIFTRECEECLRMQYLQQRWLYSVIEIDQSRAFC